MAKTRDNEELTAEVNTASNAVPLERIEPIPTMPVRAQTATPVAPINGRSGDMYDELFNRYRRTRPAAPDGRREEIEKAGLALKNVFKGVADSYSAISRGGTITPYDTSEREKITQSAEQRRADYLKQLESTDNFNADLALKIFDMRNKAGQKANENLLQAQRWLLDRQDKNAQNDKKNEQWDKNHQLNIDKLNALKNKNEAIISDKIPHYISTEKWSDIPVPRGHFERIVDYGIQQLKNKPIPKTSNAIGEDMPDKTSLEYKAHHGGFRPDEERRIAREYWKDLYDIDENGKLVNRTKPSDTSTETKVSYPVGGVTGVKSGKRVVIGDSSPDINTQAEDTATATTVNQPAQPRKLITPSNAPVPMRPQQASVQTNEQALQVSQQYSEQINTILQQPNLTDDQKRTQLVVFLKEIPGATQQWIIETVQNILPE